MQVFVNACGHVWTRKKPILSDHAAICVSCVADLLTLGRYRNYLTAICVSCAADLPTLGRLQKLSDAFRQEDE